jgi:hypothetical protein
LTYCVVAILEELSFGVVVGAVGAPSKVGEIIGAKDLATNSVVASLDERSPRLGVGALGEPVKVGDSRGAPPNASRADVGVSEPVPPDETARGRVSEAILLETSLLPEASIDAGTPTHTLGTELASSTYSSPSAKL